MSVKLVPLGPKYRENWPKIFEKAKPKPEIRECVKVYPPVGWVVK